MRTTFMALCLTLFAAIATAQDQAAPPQVVNAYDLNDGKAVITGRFGQPLGDCVQLQAKIVVPDERKGGNGDYLLLVTHVNGRELRRPVGGVEFTVTNLAIGRIAHNHFELFEMRTGKKAQSVSTQIMEKLEVGYVGSVVNVIAYETGGFFGKANNLPKDIPEEPAIQMRGPDTFRFHLSLYVVKVEDEPARQVQAPAQK